jgi:ribosome-associated protein
MGARSRHPCRVTSDLLIRRGISVPRSELSWRFAHAGGPGGQSVNTADSKVDLRWDIAGSTALPEHLRQRALSRLENHIVDGVLIVTATQHRSQLHNRRAAEARLVALLVAATAPEPARRRPTKPSRGSVAARLASKRHRSVTKQRRGHPGDDA